jgi:lysine biosynthesis protein LysW
VAQDYGKEITMSSTYCPECDERIVFNPGKPKFGQRLSCPSCSAELEVISIDPLELDWAYDWEWDEDEEEDDDDYDDDYDDEYDD